MKRSTTDFDLRLIDGTKVHTCASWKSMGLIHHTNSILKQGGSAPMNLMSRGSSLNNMNKNKKILLIFLVSLLMPIVCVNTIAFSSSDDNNGVLAYQFTNQLSDEEKKDLLTEEYYSPSINVDMVKGYPIMKLREEVFWQFADKPFEEFLLKV